jgi:Mg2+-importing ATPase
MIKQPSDFWSIPQADVLVGLDTRQEGLERAEARKRLVNYGANLLKPPKRSDTVTLLLAQFKSPIILTLIFAAGLSFFLQDHMDAAIILFIVLVSGLLGFWQERGAADAVEKLLSIVKIKTTVLRDGNLKDIPLEYVVPGDVVILNAGEAIPADCLILEAKGLFVDEATLTGETPRRWNISFIRKFMFTFGLISSIFDYLTFAVLLFILHATPEQFRT